MLNKKRLAALGLSAVMVASTASLPVSAADFSDGSDVVAAQNDVVTDESADVEVNDDAQDTAGGEVTAFTGKYNADTGKIDYTYNGELLHADVDPELTVKTDAKCETDGSVIYKGRDKSTNLIVATAPITLSKEIVRKEHLNSKVAFKTTKTRINERCEIEEAPAVRCTICDTEYLTGEYVKTEKTSHNVPEEGAKITYKVGANTQLVDGDDTKEPQLIDPKKPGSFTKVFTGTCKTCLQPNVSREETVNVPAKGDVEIREVKISDFKNIKCAIDENLQMVESFKENAEVTGDLPKNENIVLEDCTKEGSYVVTTYYTDGTNDGGETVTVPTHHVYVDAVYEKSDFVKGKGDLVALNDAGKEDKALTAYLEPVWNKEKTKIVDVINTNCAKDIKYKITSTCVSEPEKHFSEREGVAAKSTTNHVLDADAAAFKTTVENVLAGKRGPLTSTELAAISKNANVKITPETATCVKSGTISVEFYCKICGTKTASYEKVKSGKLEHYIKAYSKENVIAPTCEKSGSYEQVEKCKICGEEIRRDTVVTKALGHTNDKGDVKGAEVYAKMYGDRLIPQSTDIKVGQVFEGEAALKLGDSNLNAQIVTKVYTNCATCHDNEKAMDLKTLGTVKNLKVIVTNIKNAVYRQTTGNGDVVEKMVTPGTIDLKVTYTRATGETVTTETSFLYGNKKGIAFPEEYRSGLEKDENGVYRYYKDGQFDPTYVGFAELDGEQFFVNKGLIEKSTGLKLHEGKWYNLAEGRLTAEYTGAILYDGAWFYVTNGVMNTSKSGLADYNGGTFLFTDGRLRNDVNGLWLDPTTGIWYFLSNGQVQTQHTGVAMYDGAFFYIQGGQLAKNYKGTVKYDGHTFNVVEGQLYGPIK